MWILKCKLDKHENNLALSYVSKFSGTPLQLEFINGRSDLNDFDEFLENTIEHYAIGQLTLPELALLEQISYGFALQYANKSDHKNFLKLENLIQVAYQDMCRMGIWIRKLFSSQFQKTGLCSFTVKKGVTKMIYKRKSSTQIKSIASYACIYASYAESVGKNIVNCYYC